MKLIGTNMLIKYIQITVKLKTLIVVIFMTMSTINFVKRLISFMIQTFDATKREKMYETPRSGEI